VQHLARGQAAAAATMMAQDASRSRVLARAPALNQNRDSDSGLAVNAAAGFSPTVNGPGVVAILVDADFLATVLNGGAGDVILGFPADFLGPATVLSGPAVHTILEFARCPATVTVNGPAAMGAIPGFVHLRVSTTVKVIDMCRSAVRQSDDDQRASGSAKF
jgi:hypothetical protein